MGEKGKVIGLAAHVDAGKTTLSESLLYLSGTVRRQGRVDRGDAFLDTDRMEKERGITIFSKQAILHSLPEKASHIGRTALILVGSFLQGVRERSRLYDPAFSHLFREASQ